MAFTSIRAGLPKIGAHLPVLPIAAALHTGAETAKQLIMNVSHHANADPATLTFAGLTTMALATASTLWLGSRIRANDIAKNPARPPRTWGSSFREASLYPGIAFGSQILILAGLGGIAKYTTLTPASQDSLLQGISIALAGILGTLTSLSFNHDYPLVQNDNSKAP